MKNLMLWIKANLCFITYDRNKEQLESFASEDTATLRIELDELNNQLGFLYMSSYPRSVELKLNRAVEQSQLLKSEIDAWTIANPIKYKTEFREGKLGFRVIHEGFLNPPPTDRWSLIFGELIHNLRSALDNLAWALALVNKNPPDNPRAIQFPIYIKKANFDKKADLVLSQMTKDIAEIITAMQPFEQEPDNPIKSFLVTLQSLNNQDKHQLPIIAFASQKILQCKYDVGYFTLEDKEVNKIKDVTYWSGEVPLNAGTILVDFKTKHPLKSFKAEVYCDLCFSVKRTLGMTPVDWLANYLVVNITPMVKTFDLYFPYMDKKNAERGLPVK